MIATRSALGTRKISVSWRSLKRNGVGLRPCVTGWESVSLGPVDRMIIPSSTASSLHSDSERKCDNTNENNAPYVYHANGTIKRATDRLQFGEEVVKHAAHSDGLHHLDGLDDLICKRCDEV